MTDTPDDSDFLAALFRPSDDNSLRAFVDAAPMTKDRLARFDPIRTAAAFGVLLTRSALQGSALRLESLVHLALSAGHGSRRPTPDVLAQAFDTIGTSILKGSESESEDLFVNYIRSAEQGGFRVLEGNWLGGGFHLRRVVEIVDDMPDQAPFDRLKASVFALLKLSDLVCDRAGLARYAMGNIAPSARLGTQAAAQGVRSRHRLRFTLADLKAAGVRSDDLVDFELRPDDRETLLSEPWGATPLEARPLVRDGEDLYFLLPSAVSIAIRRRVIDHLTKYGMLDDFRGALEAVYGSWFAGLRHFGVGMAGRSLRFQQVPGARLAAMSRLMDAGRRLNIIFVLEDLADIQTTGLAGFNPRVSGAAKAIETMISMVYDQAVAQGDFRGGLTLVVACGIGRPMAISFEPTPRDNWFVESLSAADLETLSQLRRFSLFELWRVLEARDRLKEAGARLYAASGPLQLLGQARVLEGHLVDHGHFPDGAFAEGEPRIVVVDPYVVLRLRQEAAETWDAHVESDVDGQLVRVTRSQVPLFDEDEGSVGYIEEGPPLRGIYLTPRRAWWWRLTNASDDIDALHQRWQTLETWVRRAAPVLDETFTTLPEGPIEWEVTFDAELLRATPPREPIDLTTARSGLSATADASGRRLHTRATAEFERAFSCVENVAEQALVEALVTAAAAAAREALDPARRDEIVKRIVPGPMARQTHAFGNPSFRDYVRGSLPAVTQIELDEDGLSRIGLGWKARSRSEPPWVEGKPDTVAFLNRLVTCLEDDLIADLRTFDRQALVSLILSNHEAAAVAVADYKRTAAANLALHEDKRAVLDTLGERESKLNAVALSSRILLEAAVSECPETGGRRPGVMDLSRLMIGASQIFHYGGDSDAVHWDAMPARVRITPLGDVHADRSFASAIVEPWGRQNADVRFGDAAEDYADNVAPRAPSGDTSALWEDEFLEAVKETLGAAYYSFRLLLDYLEDLSIRSGQAVLIVRRSTLIAVDTDGGTLPREEAERAVDALTYGNRPGWRSVPEGYVAADRQPWRFRRRLSVLRRPLLKLNDDPDPLMAVAPGLAREAWVYLINNFYRGDLPDAHLSRGLISWKAKVADRRGRQFEQDVADRLRDIGWKAEVSVKMTRLLDRGFERDFGDVDVLAWREDGSRVLLIECKDVQYRKTYGEIAEQLADFRGVANARNKRDKLRLHLDRVDLAQSNVEAVAKYLRLPSVARLESHLVFRNPVPMRFALAKMQEQVSVHTFADIGQV